MIFNWNKNIDISVGLLYDLYLHKPYGLSHSLISPCWSIFVEFNYIFQSCRFYIQLRLDLYWPRLHYEPNIFLIFGHCYMVVWSLVRISFWYVWNLILSLRSFRVAVLDFGMELLEHRMFHQNFKCYSKAS